MRKKTREGKGAVNNEMWNISGGKRRPCCGYGSEKVMSKGHYLQLLKRKYKFTYKEKNRKTKILRETKTKTSGMFPWANDHPLCCQIWARKSRVKSQKGNLSSENTRLRQRQKIQIESQKSKGEFVIGKYKTKTKNTDKKSKGQFVVGEYKIYKDKKIQRQSQK